MSFRALVTRKADDRTVSSSIERIEEEALPQGSVTVDIAFAGLNYKDGLCLLGKGGLVHRYPHVAGIDFSGTVRTSTDARYARGDRVVLTGWRVGETRWGGFAERARVEAEHLVPLPHGLSLRDAMVLGTAGLTAMVAIGRLEAAGLAPGSGPVAVTGAAGGVGSIAMRLLARLGYETVAISGREREGERLRALGAARVLLRDDVLSEPDKPLESGRWAGVVDSVGGRLLGKLLAQVAPGGSVASIGNAGGIALETTVLPFILRGISLLGIDSVTLPYAVRQAAWARLAGTIDLDTYAAHVTEIGLKDLPEAAERILAGQIAGRTVIRIG